MTNNQEKVIQKDILGVYIDIVYLDQASKMVLDWLTSGQSKKYIVTPNPEIIMAAQKDPVLMEALNKADLKIPDSWRLSWASRVMAQESFLSKLLFTPFVLLPRLTPKREFEVTTGVDLMGEICKLIDEYNRKKPEKAIRIGFLGGEEGVAVRAAKRLKKLYPALSVAFAEPGPRVNMDGTTNKIYKLPSKADLLFVAFGFPKQEKWLSSNLDKLPIKVGMVVGGSFDYYSSKVRRAPKLVRLMGFEWLFRLILQPGRIKRQLVLPKFVMKVLTSK